VQFFLAVSWFQNLLKLLTNECTCIKKAEFDADFESVEKVAKKI
jgi:hypothetical protein